MSTAYNRIVDALCANGKQVIERGDGKAQAQCPAHDDHNPSLEIKPRRDGRGIVVHCHAGCHYQAVLEAVGLKPRDLYDDAAMRDVYKPNTDYVYPDGSRKRRRTGPDGVKHMSWRKGGSGGAALYLVDKIPADCPLVFLVESEKAAEAVWAMGAVAVSTGGAGRTNVDLSPLRDRHIIAVVDRDRSGLRWAAALRGPLDRVAASVRFVRCAVDIPKADVVEHIDAGYSLDQLEGFDPTTTTYDDEPSPSDESPVIDDVDGAALLEDLHATLLRYVAFPDRHAAVAVTLWAAVTHALPAFECAPRLVVTSPQKRCGKSRLLDIIEYTCHRPLSTVDATVAAVFRSLGGERPPTLVIDEADAIFGSKKAAEQNEDLHKLLNSGHQRGRMALRCVGPSQIPTEFNTFAMAALAGIGDMPDTITDRAVNVTMRRRAPHERVSQFRSRRDGPVLKVLRDRLASWAVGHIKDLTAAEPDLPAEDRAADTWEPLIAVADCAGGDWPAMARAACRALVVAAEGADETRNLATLLLADIRQVFADCATPFLSSQLLVDELRHIDESPWGDFELTTRKLAYRLKDFGVTPGHNAAKTARGYHLGDFADAFARYIRPDPSIRPKTPVDLQERPDGSDRPGLVESSADGSIRPDVSKRPEETAGQTPFPDGWTGRDGYRAGNVPRFTGFVPPTGPGRCTECGCHVKIQGHKPDCQQTREEPQP